MPKIVDHDQRRQELVETTWRIIARRGLSGATMRQIAHEAGYANGALKPYFATKDELLEATYQLVFERSDRRIEEALRGRRGLQALRALCLEVLPVSPDLVDEARLVIAFWNGAAHDPDEAALASGALDRWRSRILSTLDQAQADGELREGVDHARVAGLLLGQLFGSQVTAVVDPVSFNGDRLGEHLDGLLDLLRA